MSRKFFTEREVRPWRCCQRSCECPVPGGTHSRVGCGSWQPELLGGSVAHGRGLGLIVFKDPSNPNHTTM